MYNSLRIRLTIIFIGLAIGPLIVVGLILAQRSFTVEREQALELQQQVAQRVAAEIDSFLGELASDANRIVGELRNLEQPDRAQQISLLLGAFGSGPYRDVYEEFALLDAQGQEQLRLSRDEIISADELRDLSGTAEFEQPRTTGNIYFSPVWFDDTGKAFLTIAIPFSEPRSVELKGVLIAYIRFKKVSELIAGLQVGQTQTIYVVDSGGQVVAHRDSALALQELHFEVPQSDSNQTGLDGSDVVVGTDEIKLGGQELIVVAERLAAEALKSATDTVYTLAGILIGALIIAAGIGFLVIRQIVRPIEAMSTTAQAISDGDLSQQVEIASRDEIGTLANAFNSMTIQLRGMVRSLEDQVQERTAELTLSMEVGQRASTTRDLNALLSTITEFIRSQFDLYYVHIYMVDHLSQNLIIKSGTGTVGQQLLARRHSLPIGPGSIVGRVAAESKTIVVPNTQHSDVHKPNPLLPNTKSEIAVPLIANDQVIGVLDLQDDKAETFTQHNVTVFEAMATQLAVAIDSAQQWTAAQEAQNQLEQVIRRLTRDSWATTLTGRKKPLNFVYDLQEVKTVDSANVENGAVSVPVTVQNEPIGQLSIQPPTDRGLTADEQTLLAEVAQQLAQKAENLRLFEDTQRQATREQITRQIADKIRASRDIETALKTAAEELSLALGTARTAIDLRVKTHSDDDNRELSE